MQLLWGPTKSCARLPVFAILPGFLLAHLWACGNCRQAGAAGEQFDRFVHIMKPWSSRVLMRGPMLAVAVFFVALAAPARAGPSLADSILPPTNLQGAWDAAAQQLTLTWTAPDDAAYTYHVYRDHKEVAQTPTTRYTDAQPFNLV